MSITGFDVKFNLMNILKFYLFIYLFICFYSYRGTSRLNT